jgi:hypothetical protein
VVLNYRAGETKTHAHPKAELFSRKEGFHQMSFEVVLDA